MSSVFVTLQVAADSQLCVVLVTGTDQGTLGSVQLLPGTDPLLGMINIIIN